MSNCSFCGAAIEPATGKMYIKKDGTVLRFDSSKCQRNMVELGRINRYVGWTEAHKVSKAPAPVKAAKPAPAPKAPKKKAAAKAEA